MDQATLPKSHRFIAWLRDLLAIDYGIHVVELVPLFAGESSWSYIALTYSQKFFVKIHSQDTCFEQADKAIRLAMLARKCSIPVPTIIHPIRTGLSISSKNGLIELWEWSENSEPLTWQHTSAWEEAGAILSRIHVCFSKCFRSELRLDRPKKWLLYNHQRKVEEFESVFRNIRFENQAECPEQLRDVLIAHRAMLGMLPDLIRSLPNLTAQMLHGDFNPPNILCKGNIVKAIIDFGIPEPYFIEYELGRFALHPELVLNHNQWLKVSTQIVKKYCEELSNSICIEVEAIPRLWLAHLIRNLTGFLPLRSQSALAQRSWWIKRSRTAQVLIQNIEDIEAAFRRASNSETAC